MSFVLYHFLFGHSKNKHLREVKKDDEKAKNMLDMIEDEPIELLNQGQDVSPATGGHSIKMSYELSKLNFKAKNQASALSIHEPFASKFRKKEIFESI